MSKTRMEVRRAINQENVYVREDDLRALDQGEVQSIPSFRNLSSETPTRRITRSEIWDRAHKPVDVNVQSTTEFKGSRWGTSNRGGALI